MIPFQNKLYKIYLIIVGCLIIFLNIYFRFFHHKEIIILKELKTNSNYYTLFFNILFCIIQLIIIIAILYSLYKKYYNINTKPFFIEYLNKIINKLYWEPLNYLHDIIAPDLPGSARFFFFITKFIERGNKDLRYKLYYNSYIIFSYFPILFMSLLFFYEIIFLNQLKYFLFFLPLFLLPLIFNIYIKLSKSCCERNSIVLLKYIYFIETIIDDKGNKMWSFAFKPEFSHNSSKRLNELSDDFIILQKINYNVEIIEKNRDKNYHYILLSTSMLFLTAGIYRLFYFLI